MDIYKYFIISTAIFSFSYVMFLFVFRNETNFRLLRVFIIVIILASLLIPFNSLKLDGFTINTDIKTSIESIPKVVKSNINHRIYFSGTLNQIQNTVSVINWKKIIKHVYFTITLLLLIRTLFSLFAIYLLYYKSKKENIDNLIIVRHNYIKPPFSFFNWIFISQEQFKENELDQIITHEKIHAFQYHSIDVLIIELFSSFFWFNPFVWKMRSNLKLIHEYLADEGALKTGIDKHSYQVTLINQVVGGQILNLASNFNRSIKKRTLHSHKFDSKQRTDT